MGRPSQRDFKAFLDEQVELFNQPGFIKDDPISIPHQYTKPQDIEITGFWAAVLAWGQRVTIIKKCTELFAMMDNAPYQFILHHKESDLKPFTAFKHRTFNATDTLYFIHWLKHFYTHHDSLEETFIIGLSTDDEDMEVGLTNFHNQFFDLPEAPQRTRKHIATPARKSACKRLNMYLRWMVRQDDKGVDFGLWKKIKPSQLVCPCDLHVDRVARKFNLITRKGTDWQTAKELTTNLKKYDPQDPVKYDFALFGLGVLGDY
ncbi:MAG: TIGR02757 family protein [Cyclobacteriaceae bacterium]